MKRRVFSMLLVLVMVFTGMDITAFAQVDSAEEVLTITENETLIEEEVEVESTQEEATEDITDVSTEEIAETSSEETEDTYEETTVVPEETETDVEIVATSEFPVETEVSMEVFADAEADGDEITGFQVNENTTLTENVAVNGDLYIKKGVDLFLNGYTLEIGGNAEIYGDIDLGGGALTVSGNALHTYGGITFGGGNLTIGGDYHLEEQAKDGTYNQGMGYLLMTNPSDTLDVNGDFFFNGSASNNVLSAGAITLAGDVTLSARFSGSDTHRMVFDGNDVQRIYFNNDVSCANELEIKNDKVIVERLSFATLLSDATVSGNNADIWAPEKNPLSLNGHSLTVNGNLTLRGRGKGVDLAGGKIKVNGNVIHSSGKITFNGGSIETTGDYRIQEKTTDENGQEIYESSSGSLIMTDSQAALVVGGDFISNSSASSNYEMTAGTIHFVGNVSINDRFFRGTGTHRVVFEGTQEQTVYIDHTDSYFCEVEIKNEKVVLERLGLSAFVADTVCNAKGAVIWAGGNELSLNGHEVILNGDINVGVNSYMELNLAGGELKVMGDFLHSVGNLVFNKGKLLIGGDYHAAKKETDKNGNTVYSDSSTALIMNYEEDYMDVDGDFISDSSHSYDHELTAGLMELAGNVNIADAYFKCEGTHKAILDGGKKQIITFSGTRAYFNVLQLTRAKENYEFNPNPCWKTLIEAKEFLIKYEETHYYTGKAIEPKVEVCLCESKELLENDKDYTVSYQKNINAGNAATIIVKGKGNYDGTSKETFKILKRDVGDEEVTADEFSVTYNKKVQKKVPVLYHNGKKLVVKKDFTVSYPDVSAGAYKEPGTYTVVISGKGNYTGTREVSFTITNVKFMNDVKISKIAAQPYNDGKPVTMKDMAKPPVVKYGNTVLKENVHFKATYVDNTKVGTATMTLTGTGVETPEGIFSGSKAVTFKINGTSIAKAKVSGIPKSMTYSGKAINESSEGWGESVKVELAGTKLVRAKDENSAGDYVVIFENNVNKGSASVIIKGINKFTGSAKKKFAIKAYDMNGDAEQKNDLVKEKMAARIAFAKGGSKPEPLVTFGQTTLVKDKDYTLSYANNKKWNDGSGNKKPTVTIKGKGNFNGKVKLTFAIDKQDIGNLVLTAPDTTYKKSKGAYRSAIVVADLDGKVLKNNTDYTVAYTYAQNVTLDNREERKSGDEVKVTDIVPAKTLLRVTVFGKGNYTADNPLTTTYMVVKGSVANAKVTIPSQKYTGAPITFTDKTKITVKIGKDKLGVDDFVIVEGSYENNTDAGTASFIIKGVGNYGGVKKVTFKITKKKFDAWWSVLFG